MFVVLHQALHVPQLPVQFSLVVVDQVHLAPQTRHEGLEHGLDVGPAHRLALQQLQLCLEHLVLLLQETHLRKNKIESVAEGSLDAVMHLLGPIWRSSHGACDHFVFVS